MAKLTRDDVLHLAQLARLQLSDAEIELLQGELSAILGYVQQLEEVDISDLEPTTQVSGLTNVMRDDKPVDYQTSRDAMLKLAPQTKDGHIVVKRVVS